MESVIALPVKSRLTIFGFMASKRERSVSLNSSKFMALTAKKEEVFSMGVIAKLFARIFSMYLGSVSYTHLTLPTKA